MSNYSYDTETAIATVTFKSGKPISVFKLDRATTAAGFQLHRTELVVYGKLTEKQVPDGTTGLAIHVPGRNQTFYLKKP